MVKTKIFIIVIILAAVTYSYTITPTIGTGDSGELTSCAHTLGVAHPPGYVLFTLLGKIFSFIPWGSMALRVNLLSLISAVATIGFLFSLLKKNLVAATFASLFFIFSYTFWSESSAAEVYTLNLLFLTVAFWLLHRWREDNDNRYIIFFAYICGLALTHHLTFLLYFPLFLYLIITAQKFDTKSILPGFLFFLLALTITIYLPIRANSKPALNWGNPDNLSRLFNHITAAQYRSFAFGLPLIKAIARIGNIFRLLLREFTIIAVLIIPGIYHCIKKRKRFLISLFLIFIFNFFYSINYDIPDYDVYLLPTFLVGAIFIGIGIAYIWHKIRFNMKYLLLLLPLVPFIKNLKANVENKRYYVYDCAVNTLNSLPEDAIFITSSDVYANGILYLQQIENRKQQITIVSYDMMKSDDYYEMMEKKIDLPKVPSDYPIIDIIEYNIRSRPIYTGIDLMQEIFLSLKETKQDYAIIPVGLVNQVSKDASIELQQIAFRNNSLWQKFQIRDVAKRRLPITKYGKIQFIYGIALNNIGAFYLNHGMLDQAEKVFLAALSFPNRPDVVRAIRRNLRMISNRRQNHPQTP